MPPTSRRANRVFAATLGVACLFAVFGARASRSQDQPGPTPPPPPQQTDRPPWARKNKSSSKNNTDSSKTTDTTPSSTASTNPPPIVQPIPADDPPADQQQRGRIKVNVQLVSVLTSVLDEHNRPAIDIPRESFHIFEEGVEQKLEVFESETQQPLDLALMIDASLSAHKEISFEQEAAARFIRQILRPNDRLAVYSVGEKVVMAKLLGQYRWVDGKRTKIEEESMFLVSAEGHVIHFRIDEVNVLSGAGRGVIGIKLHDGDTCIGGSLVADHQRARAI